MGNVKITYNGTQLSEEEISGDASISYNGSVIGSCAEGETKTLNCSGLYMNGNVVIGGKTLNCANNIMTGNVVVSNESTSMPYIVFSSPSSFAVNAYNKELNCDGTIEYSTNGNTWNTWDGSKKTSVLIGSAYKLFFRGTGNTHLATSTSVYTRFIFSGSNISCNGNIMCLLDYQNPSTTITGSYCFHYLFRAATQLISSPQLPATTLSKYCYSGMFYGCTNLASVPKLPATTLAERCYTSMFRGCTSLVSLPKLIATTLKTYCYYYMFNGCSGIKVESSYSISYRYQVRIPTEGTGTTASNALAGMFIGTGGTFTGTPAINTSYYTNRPLI